jgi:uncharacterized phage protein (TIGR01671 family)
MRNPIFRIWNKRTGKWQEKDFHLIGEVMLLQGFPLEWLKDLEINQFTGLKDPKGTNIYEGDVLKHQPDGYEPHELLEVFWDDRLCGFACRTMDPDHLYQTPIMEKDYKVVGNIYENPNLLSLTDLKLV